MFRKHCGWFDPYACDACRFKGMLTIVAVGFFSALAFVLIVD